MLLNERNQWMRRLLPGGAAMLVAMIVATVFQAMAGETAGQKSFDSPSLAVSALIDAVRDNDDVGLLAILGPGTEDLVSSGDKIADGNDRKNFLKAYDEKNSLEEESDDRAVLMVGGGDYPFPIPIVRQEGVWLFDTKAGMEEILNRRIGGNELHTIDVMRAYTEAQREYACMKPEGGISAFARKLASSDGKKDGLYWAAAQGEQQSPFGPLIARAADDGYSGGLDKNPAESFHGYYFKILEAQGEHANGGAFNYVVDGKMVLGFALVAFPAKYGASGIMTFIVNQEGVIHEKDRGEDTARAALAMTIFDPDDGWRKYGRRTEN